MTQYLLNFPDWQKDSLRDLSDKTGYTMAELIRRMLDNSLREDTLCALFPFVSGQVEVRAVR